MGKFSKDELGTRMKEYYENIPKTKLVRRTLVAIRLDGSHFHTFTRGFQKPFDKVLQKSMQEAMKYCCENIMGCVLGYTQSDEITLILTDYKKLTSAAWFDYEVMKICSTSAAMATMAFNKAFEKNATEWLDNYYEAWNHSEKEDKLAEAYEKAIETGATFDSRAFNIPKEEVANLLYWRQHDASKNSVSMAAYAYFPHNEVQNKNTAEKMDMLMIEKGINWNDYPTTCKRGSCCVKSEKGWVIDNEIPIFKGEGRSYVEDRVLFTTKEEAKNSKKKESYEGEYLAYEFGDTLTGKFYQDNQYPYAIIEVLSEPDRTWGTCEVKDVKTGKVFLCHKNYIQEHLVSFNREKEEPAEEKLVVDEEEVER